MNNKYKIINELGPFGYTTNGDGHVVYLSIGDCDFDAIEQIVEYGYGDDLTINEDGEEIMDWSEYDPSVLETQTVGTITDSFDIGEFDYFPEIESIDLEDERKDKILEMFLLLLTEILEMDIPVIYIDKLKRTIEQIDSIEEIKNLLTIDINWEITVKEYDHIFDN